ncbi:hypothetical protein SATRM34S_06878 [Streptomyces atroolivaceus]
MAERRQTPLARSQPVASLNSVRARELSRCSGDSGWEAESWSATSVTVLQVIARCSKCGTHAMTTLLPRIFRALEQFHERFHLCDLCGRTASRGSHGEAHGPESMWPQPLTLMFPEGRCPARRTPAHRDRHQPIDVALRGAVAWAARSIRSNVPSAAHLRKRVCSVAHGPYRPGTSRQADPVRNFHTILLMTLRLSSRLRPGNHEGSSAGRTPTRDRTVHGDVLRLHDRPPQSM